MRKKSHWRLADYLMRDNERPAIEFMFKVGSVAPDFMIRSMIKGHSYSTTTQRVERRLSKLEQYGRWNLVSAYRLGYVTHYVADYFTAPHNEHGEFGLRDHCAFEKQQLYRLRSQLRGQWNTPKQYQMQGDVMEYIKTIHDEYLEQMPQVETDCSYIVNVTEQIAYQMFSLFNERQTHAAHARFFRHHAAM